MKPQTKKILMREGLIILGIATGGFVIAFVSDYIVQHSKCYIDYFAQRGLKWWYEPLSFRLFWNRVLALFSVYDFPSIVYTPISPYYKIRFVIWMEHFGEFIFLYGYLVYFPVRFIPRVIKTLKSKWLKS